MTQRNLFEAPSRGVAADSGVVGRRAVSGEVDHPKAAKKRKRVAITTLEAWYKILPTLPKRERAVACALQRFFLRSPSRWPTAYELFEFMKEYEQNVFDVNSVRPVLTRLKDKDIVQFGVRVVCGVTGMKVFTWEFVQNLQLLLWAEGGPPGPFRPTPGHEPGFGAKNPLASKTPQDGPSGKSGPEV